MPTAPSTRSRPTRDQPGGWEVLRRLGSGSTARSPLLARRPGDTEPEVLKVAREEDHAERLLGEAGPSRPPPRAHRAAEGVGGSTDEPSSGSPPATRRTRQA